LLHLLTSGSDAVDGSSTGTGVPSMWGLLRLPRFGGAKHANDYDGRSRRRKVIFQVHGVDVAGQVLVRRQLKRRHVIASFQKLPPCLVGIEACASSHQRSRELQTLDYTVRLMPPAT
jgi:transposase